MSFATSVKSECQGLGLKKYKLHEIVLGLHLHFFLGKMISRINGLDHSQGNDFSQHICSVDNENRMT